LNLVNFGIIFFLSLKNGNPAKLAAIHDDKG
jgi:hypothetical protein